MAQYQCEVCGFIFDEGKRDEKWDELPDYWVCPRCGVGCDRFILLE